MRITRPGWTQFERRNVTSISQLLHLRGRNGREFADALIEKAHSGVAVRLLDDWMGEIRKASDAF